MRDGGLRIPTPVECEACGGKGVVWDAAEDQRGSEGRELFAGDAAPEPAKLCRNCKHFDLEEGQAVLRKSEHGAFMHAAALLKPAEMGLKVLHDDNGEMLIDDAGVPIREKPSLPMKTGWDQAGACLKDEMIIFDIDTCEKWEAKE